MVIASIAVDYVNTQHVGLVFKSDACFIQGPQYHEAAYQDGDAWFEELTVFPIVNGMVDLAAIRAHMGY